MSNLPPPPPPPPSGSGGPPSVPGGPFSSAGGGAGSDLSRLPLASWGRRLGAFAIDAVIGAVVVLVAVVPSIEVERDADGVITDVTGPQGGTAWIIIAFVLGSLIWGGLLIGLWGRTPGKAALKLKVVSADDHGQLLGFLRGTGREAARGVVNFIPIPVVVFLVFLVDHLWPLWDDQNQTLHDKVIRSHVVYTGGN